MKTIKVELLKPLNGRPIGSHSEYSEADFRRLSALGAVRRVKMQSQPKNKQQPAPKNKAKADRTQGE